MRRQAEDPGGYIRSARDRALLDPEFAARMELTARVVERHLEAIGSPLEPGSGERSLVKLAASVALIMAESEPWRL